MLIATVLSRAYCATVLSHVRYSVEQGKLGMIRYGVGQGESGMLRYDVRQGGSGMLRYGVGQGKSGMVRHIVQSFRVCGCIVPVRSVSNVNTN